MGTFLLGYLLFNFLVIFLLKFTAFISNNLLLIVCCIQLMICVIFTSKLEIPENGNDVLDNVLDAKLWLFQLILLRTKFPATGTFLLGYLLFNYLVIFLLKFTAFLSNNLLLIVCCIQLMICVIFTSKLEIPEDGNDVLDNILDAKLFWFQSVCLVIGDLTCQ